MRKFTGGLALGLALGMAGTAMAAQLTGSNGYITGWYVSIDGDTVCTDPYVWVSIREIECD